MILDQDFSRKLVIYYYFFFHLIISHFKGKIVHQSVWSLMSSNYDQIVTVSVSSPCFQPKIKNKKVWIFIII